MLPDGNAPRSWRESVLGFAESCHFDRNHSLQVAHLFPPSRLLLRLSGTTDLSVEIYGANSKSDLFRKAFDLQLVLEPVAS